ncbi:MAG: hypothetical protein LBF66_02660 [Holosporales bacterium]|jgi:hypothetical protein|nr:hypothetical protein [Holosporales bacterium]
MNEFANISILGASLLAFVGSSVILRADPGTVPATQATSSAAIVARGEELARNMYESFEGMSEAVSKQLESLGWCINNIQISNDSQDAYIVTVLKGILSNGEVKQLPELYIDALNFVGSWLQSPDQNVRNAAIRVLLTLQALTRDVWGRNHAAEFEKLGKLQLSALDNISNIKLEQLEWVLSVGDIIKNRPPTEPRLWNSIGAFLIQKQASKHFQPDILQAIVFCSSIVTLRDPALRKIVSMIYNKLIETVSRLRNEVPKTTQLPSAEKERVPPTKAANVGRKAKAQCAIKRGHRQ